MISEWLTSLFTPCQAHVRRMGYLREAIALSARYKRCARAWQPHLENSQNLIRDAMADCPGTNRAVVLGSGLLAEIPLAEMARRFDEVVLVDILHLRAARRQAALFANVRVVDEDVTGIVHRVTKAEPLPEPTVYGPAVADHADFVVSVGLASQLPLLPVEYAERGASESAAFAAAVIQAHMDWLQSLSATVCLIADTERVFLEQGAVASSEDALAGVVVPSLPQTWWWDIAPAPEAMVDIDVRFKVRGGIV